MFDDAMTTHLYQRRKEKGEEVTLEQVRRDFLEGCDRAGARDYAAFLGFFFLEPS